MSTFFLVILATIGESLASFKDTSWHHGPKNRQKRASHYVYRGGVLVALMMLFVRGGNLSVGQSALVALTAGIMGLTSWKHGYTCPIGLTKGFMSDCCAAIRSFSIRPVWFLGAVTRPMNLERILGVLLVVGPGCPQ